MSKVLTGSNIILPQPISELSNATIKATRGLPKNIKQQLGTLRKVKLEYCLLTPAVAKALLTRQHPNRKMAETHVDKLTNIIGRGTFSPYIVSIYLDEAGIMISGQKRCQAVINTGKSVIVGIVHGVPHAEISGCEGTGQKQTLTQLVVRYLGEDVPPGPTGKMVDVLKILQAPRMRRRIDTSEVPEFAKVLQLNAPVLIDVCDAFRGKPRAAWVHKAPIRAAFAKLYFHTEITLWSGAVAAYRGKGDPDALYSLFTAHRMHVKECKGADTDEADRFYHYGTLAVGAAFLKGERRMPVWKYSEDLANRLDAQFPWPAAAKGNVIKY